MKILSTFLALLFTVSLVGPALHVESDADDAVVIDLMNNSNPGTGLLLNYDGMGRGMDLRYNFTNGSGELLNLFNQGTGHGFELIQDNALSNSIAAFVINRGIDDGLQVSNTNILNTEAAGSFFSAGTGNVLFLKQSNVSNTTETMTVRNESNQTAAANDGLGIFCQSQSLRGAYFVNKGMGNNSAGLYARNDGGGTGVAAGLIASNGSIVSNLAIYGFGDIAAASKSFLIDHPLDPENKMLKHFSIESDEAMLIYRGEVELDGNGQAIVQLKDYQNAILENVTYNLTSIGSPAQAYISKKLDKEGQFVIQADQANVTINWTIYGERADPYFKHYPSKKKVEISKEGAARGKYLYPEVLGRSAEEGLDPAYSPENVNADR